jgi:Flp pilus assembly protein TadD
MSIIHATALIALALGAAPPEKPPTEAEINRLAEALTSNDTATWRKAVDALWRAGKPALPALKKAAKSPDADVQLRARLVLGRFEWGIFPDTPEAVIKAIDRFRNGDLAQQKAAIDDLLKLGKPGYASLQLALKRETSPALRDYATNLFKTQSRTLARGLIAAGDNDSARDFLRIAAATASDPALRDLAAFWAAAGQTDEEAKALATDIEKGDANAIKLAAYFHRAKGDLAAAHKIIVGAKSKDLPLLVGLISEMEDFPTLKGLDLVAAGRRPHAIIALLTLAGDEKGAEAALARVTGTGFHERVLALLCRERPAEAMDLWARTGGPSACRLLGFSGRRRQALALKGDVWVQAEQAYIAHTIGDKDAPKMLQKAIEDAVAARANREGLLAPILRCGSRMGQRDQAFVDIGKALDRIRPTSAPRSLLYELSEDNAEAMVTLYDHLRINRKDLAPSALLAHLRQWFEKGKPDKESEALLSPAIEDRKWSPTSRAQWDEALLQLCIALKDEKRAERVLREAVKGKHLFADERLANFLFERKKYREAAELYAKVAQTKPSEPEWLYAQGAALARGGDEKKGQQLIRRARLMVLADEASAYNVARFLGRLGLADEAAAVREAGLRTGPFVDVYVNNMASALIDRAVRAKQWRKAGQLYRRIHLNLTGAFLDDAAYLRVPGMAHLYEAQALIEEGKLDAALSHAKKAAEFMPKETRPISEMVRALDKAGKKKGSDEFFAPYYARLKKDCEDYPNSSSCHNRVAWLCARARRELPAAVKYATRAVELAPKAAGVLDTLAEAQFQNGDKKAAIVAIKKALDLDPKNAYFAGQLKRFEKGDRDAKLPR